MSTDEQIFVTVRRPGKDPSTAGVPSGSSLETVLREAGISSSDYRNWSFLDEDGETLTLDTTFHGSTSVIAGQRVQGA